MAGLMGPARGPHDPSVADGISNCLRPRTCEVGPEQCFAHAPTRAYQNERFRCHRGRDGFARLRLAGHPRIDGARGGRHCSSALKMPISGGVWYLTRQVSRFLEPSFLAFGACRCPPARNVRHAPRSSAWPGGSPFRTRQACPTASTARSCDSTTAAYSLAGNGVGRQRRETRGRLNPRCSPTSLCQDVRSPVQSQARAPVARTRIAS